VAGAERSARAVGVDEGEGLGGGADVAAWCSTVFLRAVDWVPPYTYTLNVYVVIGGSEEE